MQVALAEEGGHSFKKLKVELYAFLADLLSKQVMKQEDRRTLDTRPLEDSLLQEDMQLPESKQLHGDTRPPKDTQLLEDELLTEFPSRQLSRQVDSVRVCSHKTALDPRNTRYVQ